MEPSIYENSSGKISDFNLRLAIRNIWRSDDPRGTDGPSDATNHIDLVYILLEVFL